MQTPILTRTSSFRNYFLTFDKIIEQKYPAETILSEYFSDDYIEIHTIVLEGNKLYENTYTKFKDSEPVKLNKKDIDYIYEKYKTEKNRN